MKHAEVLYDITRRLTEAENTNVLGFCLYDSNLERLFARVECISDQFLHFHCHSSLQETISRFISVDYMLNLFYILQTDLTIVELVNISGLFAFDLKFAFEEKKKHRLDETCDRHKSGYYMAHSIYIYIYILLSTITEVSFLKKQITNLSCSAVKPFK